MGKKNSTKKKSFMNHNFLENLESGGNGFMYTVNKDNEIILRKSEHSNPKDLWKESCFKIIYLVNHFVFKLKKKTLFNNPNFLNQNQLKAINDKAAKGFHVKKIYINLYI